MKGTRLPEDWKLPEQWRNWALAERPDLNPDKIAEEFRDYWISLSGQNATKLNWEATWRNWIRRQKREFNAQPRPQSHSEYKPARTTRKDWQNAKTIASNHLSALKAALK